MATLAIWCDADGMLSIVAPLALAAAAGTALVVDLEVDGPRYPGESSLARLVQEGPRLSDLRPAANGVAVLRNGGIPAAEATEVLDALRAGWPSLVLRTRRPMPGVASVPVVPLLPGGHTARAPGPAVYQQMGWHEKAPGPAVRLPTPSRATVGALLAGSMPHRNRWLRSWRQVWELRWA